MAHFEVEKSTVHHVFRETRDVVNEVLHFSGLPDTFEMFKKLSDDFQTSRSPPNPLPGCVGALDAIAIRIKKPKKHEHPATYYCRKGFYAIPVQALVDYNYRFLDCSALCRGSIHDLLAFAVSALGKYLEDGNLMIMFWIAGDAAYLCSDSLVLPFPSTMVSDEEDSFNFFHSSLHMHVEQAFGILAIKFKILKMLEFSVSDSAAVIAVAMKLHNFCVDHGKKVVARESISVKQVLEEHGMNHTIPFVGFTHQMRETNEWYKEGKHAYAALAGRQHSCSNLGVSVHKRNLLIAIIRDGGFFRPPAGPFPIPSTLWILFEQQLVFCTVLLTCLRCLTICEGWWWVFIARHTSYS